MIWIQRAGNQASVDSRNNQIFQLPGGLQAELAEQVLVRQVSRVASEREERELPELKRLLRVEGREGGGVVVVGVGAIAEDLEEGEVGSLLGRGSS